MSKEGETAVGKELDHSYELGKWSMINDISDELNRAAGTAFTNDKFNEAGFLKELSKRFRKRADGMRDEYHKGAKS